jgi:hypothetical protein
MVKFIFLLLRVLLEVWRVRIAIWNPTLVGESCVRVRKAEEKFHVNNKQ